MDDQRRGGVVNGNFLKFFDFAVQSTFYRPAGHKLSTAFTQLKNIFPLPG